MTKELEALGITVRLEGDFDEVLDRVTAALKTEGFGVLTEIDVQETLKKKLGVAFRPYRILGACNPPLAHRALSAVPQIGLLLPCNVTVVELEPGLIEVSFLDPELMLGLVYDPALEPVAREAKEKLERAAAALGQEKTAFSENGF